MAAIIPKTAEISRAALLLGDGDEVVAKAPSGTGPPTGAASLLPPIVPMVSAPGSAAVGPDVAFGGSAAGAALAIPTMAKKMKTTTTIWRAIFCANYASNINVATINSLGFRELRLQYIWEVIEEIGLGNCGVNIGTLR